MSSATQLSTPFRPLSRTSSRGSLRSLRAPSPSNVTLDDPVAIRNQISALKHSIRQQQAQLYNLENLILRGPRPLPPGFSISSSPPVQPIDLPLSLAPNFSSLAAAETSHGMSKRTSSFEILHTIAGPDSSLPLPRKDGTLPDGIREGVPMEFGVGASSPKAHRRTGSPTRTLSRIPVASVGNARTLAEDGHTSATETIHNTNGADTSSASLQPPSPNRRVSWAGGGTTKVLADLQAGVINARTALDNTKAQLRLSQRSVAQLTRQTEDLKEGRERLRLENEGLNAVVARKERLLQEVLERARKAESEAASLKIQLKNETSGSKKALREMETQLTESTALSQKSEREYITLRDSMQRLSEVWKMDLDALKQEMIRREEKWRKEAEGVTATHRSLLTEIQKANEERNTAVQLREEHEKIAKEWEAGLRSEIEDLRSSLERSEAETNDTARSAREMSDELSRLHRLMRTFERSEAPDEHAATTGPPHSQ